LPIREIVPAALIACALAASWPVQAEMSKWVDDKGVVTYSNTPPPSTASKKVTEVAERVTVDTPDAGINRAMSEEGRREASAKAASLGRQLEAERSRKPATAPPSVADRRKAAYERCRSEHRV